jgi:membrane protease YdiL (CAAX protease family)
VNEDAEQLGTGSPGAERTEWGTEAGAGDVHSDAGAASQFLADAEPPTATAPAPAPAHPRFCGVCGASWQPDWTHCTACATSTPGTRRRPAPPGGWNGGNASFYRGAPALLLAEMGAERSRLTSSIVLDFTLLAVSGVAIASRLAGASELAVEFAATLAMSGVVVLWCLAFARPALANLFRPAAPRWFFAGAGASLLTFALAYVVVEGLVRGLGLTRLSYSKPFISGGYGMATVVLMICAQPAIFEELAFRGIVFGALQPTLSANEAVFVSAGMFMILHLSPAAFPHTFAMGVIAGFIRLRSGSLLPGVLMHFVHNLLCVVLEQSPTG